MNKITWILVFMLSLLGASAQEEAAPKVQGFERIAPMNEPEMADAFRSEGKIYVVIAVLTIAFLCLVAYLVYIDIRLKKLENKK